MGIKVTILGYNSAIPTGNSHPTSQLVNVNQDYFLVDCGEGTQVQLRRAKIKFSKIHHIFISHLHGDHVFGLVGLISTLQLLGNTKPMHIYGPLGIKDFMTHQLSLVNAYSNFELIFHELTSTTSELIFENKKVEVYTLPLKHRVYCNGYLFVEKPKDRKLNMEVISTYPEIETCDYHNLKKGNDFVLPNGDIITNETLTLPPSTPKKYAFCSDTMFHQPLIELVKNVDLMYHEATFDESMKELAKKTGHSTAKEAATIAQKANVNKLMIGHFSNRYNDYNVLLNEAKEVFPNTILPSTLKEFEV